MLSDDVVSLPDRVGSLDMIVLEGLGRFDGRPYARHLFAHMEAGGIPLRRTGLTRTIDGVECEVLQVNTEREMAFAARSIADAILKLRNAIREVRAELYMARNPIDTKGE